MAPTRHSVLGASQASRWMNCPGSVRLLKSVPRRDSIYAQQGTAQHYVAEKCLKESKDAAYFQGRQIYVDAADGKVVGIDFSDDYAAAVQLYLDTIRADMEATPGSILGVETEFHLAWIHEDLFGTNDASLGQPFGLLRVYDYKGGRKPVEPTTPQLKYYALGAIGQDNPNDYTDVELVIVQPFGDGPSVKRRRMTVEELFQWQKEELEPAVIAALDESAPCIAGPWCESTFCDARPTCPAVAGKCNAVAQNMFAPLEADRPKVLPTPQLMRQDQILAVLEYGDMVQGWIDEVRGFVQSRLEVGEDLTGGKFKLVRGRANRKLNDKAEGRLTQYLRAEAYDRPKLIGITEAEKRLAKILGWEKPKIKELMDEITDRPEGKLTLAPITDSRPAASPVFVPVSIEAETATETSLDWL